MAYHSPRHPAPRSQEDVPLVPLRSLLRPCDGLVLALDFCPDFAGRRKEHVQARRSSAPCNVTAVQISFMAAVPGHPFFRCALERAVRNVEAGWYGPGDLFPTGPPLAGTCLDSLHRRIDYTLELAQGHKALFVGSRPVIRTHVWQDKTLGKRRYSSLWTERKMLKTECAKRIAARRRRSQG